MRRRLTLLVTLLLIAPSAAPIHAGERPTGKAPFKVTWKKTVVDPLFRSEGVTVVDVNRDGRADIIVGDCWYEAPKDKDGKWVRNRLRADRKFDPHGYSDSFACFAEDFNGDGYPDVIVIPFPGNPCYWYENPAGKEGLWKQHLLTNSACNETPIYVDLFKTGKRVFVMGWQPEKLDAAGKQQGNHDDRGEMCYFTPGQDPTQPWVRHSISGPSVPGKFEVPGTRRFSHGLGHGDLNGDGRADVICTGGWWEQPQKRDDAPWKFHPANLGEACADMFAFDFDGDGKADVISSSAHAYGLWWHQAKAGQELTFFRRDILPAPAVRANDSANALGAKLSKDERALFNAVNALRDRKYRKAPLAANGELCQLAHEHAAWLAQSTDKEAKPEKGYKGVAEIVVAKHDAVKSKSLDVWAAVLLAGADHDKKIAPGYEIGVGYALDADGKAVAVLLVGNRTRFALPSATHAMHHVDIDGDGLKDLVTGRRFWAHAPDAKGGGGDPGVNDPATLFWLRASKDRSGLFTFTPEVIDDDSGVGTQFEVADIDGDGIPDIIISNKKGVFLFQQVRVPVVQGTPPRRDD